MESRRVNAHGLASRFDRSDHSEALGHADYCIAAAAGRDDDTTLDLRYTAAARSPDLHLFPADRADRDSLRQPVGDVGDDRLHLRRGLSVLSATLQSHGDQSA